VPKDYSSLTPGSQLPSFWLLQIQEYISALAPDLRLTQISDVALRIVGTGHQQAVGINGLWRWVTGNADATHPGGAAGTYDVYVACSANEIDLSFNDTTDYTFYLYIRPTGTPPTGNTPAAKAIAATRKIGECDWSGTAITGFRQIVGSNDTTIPIMPQAPWPKHPAIRVRAATSHDPTVPVVTAQTSAGVELWGVYINSIQLKQPVTITGSAHITTDLTVDGNLTVTGSVTQPVGGDLTGSVANATVATWGGQSKATVVGSNPPQAHAASHSPTGSDKVPGIPPIGAILGYAGFGEPPASEGEWTIADGKLIDRTTYGAFFARTGHAYNGGVDPGSNKVRVPDHRGRKPVGAIDMGSALGAAANDNAHLQAARGSTGGEVNHVLVVQELAAHAHGGITAAGATGSTDTNHYHIGTTGNDSPDHTHQVNIGGAGISSLLTAGVGGTFSSTGGANQRHQHSFQTAWQSDSYNNSNHYHPQGGLGINSEGSNVAHNNTDPYAASCYIVRIA